MFVEHYPMPEGQEDGYSLEGFGVPILGVTVEVRESQIQPLNPEFLFKIGSIRIHDIA